MRSFTRPLIGLCLLSTLLFASCKNQGEQMQPLVRSTDDEIFLITSAAVDTGEPMELRFRVLKEGKVQNLEEQTRSLHIVLASADLEDIAHSFGLPQDDQRAYVLSHTFTRPGHYRIWAELDDDRKLNPHGKYADLIAFQDLIVTGDALDSVTPLLQQPSTTISGYTLSMEQTPIVAGQETTLRFTIRNSKGDLVTFPPAPVEPFLFGLMSTDLSFFDHGHMFADTDGASVIYAETFPHAGAYAILTQAYFFDNGEWHGLEAHFAISVK